MCWLHLPNLLTNGKKNTPLYLKCGKTWQQWWKLGQIFHCVHYYLHKNRRREAQVLRVTHHMSLVHNLTLSWKQKLGPDAVSHSSYLIMSILRSVSLEILPSQYDPCHWVIQLCLMWSCRRMHVYSIISKDLCFVRFLVSWFLVFRDQGYYVNVRFDVV